MHLITTNLIYKLSTNWQEKNLLVYINYKTSNI